jgi:hypothetical protein
MALLGGCRLHGNMGLEEACVGNVVCYVICTIINKWDLSRILEEAWNRCEKTVGLVPYRNLWQLILCFYAYISPFWWPSKLEVKPKASSNNDNLNIGDGVDLLDPFHSITNAPSCAWRI